MRSSPVFALIVVSATIGVSGCAASLYNLRIPLADDAAARTPRVDGRVRIDDLRPAAERKAHRGKDIRTSEHWFGDETVVPSKLDYLGSRLTERTRDDMPVRITLRRFDIVEYCLIVPVGDATNATPATSGAIGFQAAPKVGDTLVIRLAGEVNGMPFNLTSQFDYGTMYYSPQAPSSSPEYLTQLRGRLDFLTNQLANMVWRDALAKKSTASNP